MRKIIIILSFMAVANLCQAQGRLDGKVAIITGASRGIGVDIAKLFTEEGATIVITGRSEKTLMDVAETIQKSGGKVDYVVSDVSQSEDSKKVADFTLKKIGKIDILVHNAARYDDLGRIDVLSEKSWHEIIHTNLDGTFYAVKSVLPAMKKQKYGRIVFTSSISGPRVGLPGASSYTASKSGMNGFMKSIAIELAKHHITVNAVEPGNILTPELERVLGQDEINNRIKAVPMNRLGTGREVAYASLFLASDEAEYITGQSIIVDGGQTLPETHHGTY